MSNLVYIFAPEIKQVRIGHKNSRQAKFAFSDKPNEPICEGNGLQIYGILPDSRAKQVNN